MSALEIEYIENDELPHRITITKRDGSEIHGAGVTLSAAALRAYSVGYGFQGSAKELARALFETTRGGDNWARLIGALERGK